MGSHEMSPGQEHVVIFPFMAKGHTIPLLHLSAALSARDLPVTFVTTQGNAAFVRHALHLPDPNITLLLLPFPRVPSLPDGVESSDHLPSFNLYPAFLTATKLLRQPFHQALHRMAQTGSLPLCVVSDFFFGWTQPLCAHFGVPRLVSHGMGTFAMVLCKALVVNQTHLKGEESFHVPGTPEAIHLTVADVPETIRSSDPADPVFQFCLETGEGDVNSWGVVVNSFAGMEKEYVAPLEAFYFSPRARAWLVGPLCLHRPRAPVPDSGKWTNTRKRDACLEWLDDKLAGSVVYVAFGTQADMSAEQLDEVAHGLDMSGHVFVLVVRSPVWVPPEGTCRRGLLVRGWAPQGEALEHPATGVFLSHCGWNSVMESLCAGVPILAWPMIAEQPLNAKYVVEELGAGIRVREMTAGGRVGRGEICDGVKELMGGEERGARARRRAEEVGKAARAAVADGGSSDRCLSELLEELRKVAEGRPLDEGGVARGRTVNECGVAKGNTVNEYHAV